METRSSAATEQLPELTGVFLAAAGSLADESLAGASLLPGWSRAHVLAHVHFNAEALRRLVSWAATGVEQRMYADAAQRADEIEQGSRWEPAKVREAVAGSSSSLQAELGALTADQLGMKVVTAQGRTVPASEVFWLRCREVGVHAVDLRAGVTFADLPPVFVRNLVDDAIGKRIRDGDGPALAAWLTGRSAAAPDLGPWL